MSAVVVPCCVRLRPMRAADLPTVMEIETSAYPFPWTLQVFKDCLRVGYNASVLERDDSIIGYGIISMGAGKAHILNLCVHPNLQRCGYGQRILQHLLAFAKQKGVQSVFLEVRTSHKAAINLYDKTGFNEVGVRKKYYPNGNKGQEDGLIFAIELSTTD